jgi:hypothetical protein
VKERNTAVLQRIICLSLYEQFAELQANRTIQKTVMILSYNTGGDAATNRTRGEERLRNMCSYSRGRSGRRTVDLSIISSIERILPRNKSINERGTSLRAACLIFAFASLQGFLVISATHPEEANCRLLRTNSRVDHLKYGYLPFG